MLNGRPGVQEFSEAVAREVPDINVLDEELEILSRGLRLSEGERLDVLRMLERVYYIVLLMRELQDYFNNLVQFGGGAVLNYIFISLMDVPRFTFDLDASWRGRVEGKRRLLGELTRFNKYMAQKHPICMPVDESKCLELMVVEYDVEKNHFPDILSLRLPVITRWSGLEFYKYVRARTGVRMKFSLVKELRRIFSNTLGVRDAKIDYVRFEISFNKEYPGVEVEVELPFKLGVANLNITELEYQLASKIVYKLGRDYGEDLGYVMHDILKATLDLRLLEAVDRRRVASYVTRIAGETGVTLAEVKTNITTNTRYLVERGGDYWNNIHYILVRSKYRDVGGLVREIQRKTMETLNP
jgi:hypothetical protein